MNAQTVLTFPDRVSIYLVYRKRSSAYLKGLYYRPANMRVPCKSIMLTFGGPLTIWEKGSLGW